MHILDEAKKYFTQPCPRCQKPVKMKRLHMQGYIKAQAVYLCQCGRQFHKDIELDQAVDQIE